MIFVHYVHRSGKTIWRDWKLFSEVNWFQHKRFFKDLNSCRFENKVIRLCFRYTFLCESYCVGVWVRSNQRKKMFYTEHSSGFSWLDGRLTVALSVLGCELQCNLIKFTIFANGPTQNWRSLILMCRHEHKLFTHTDTQTQKTLHIIYFLIILYYFTVDLLHVWCGSLYQ